MTSDVDDPRERAARALCQLHGHPPDIEMDGRPTWESYLADVDVVLAAIGWEAGTITSVNDNNADSQ